MVATDTLPAWLGFSTLAWAVTGVVAAGLFVAFLAVVRGRDVLGKAVVLLLAVGIAATGLWYRNDMTRTRRSCSTTLFGAQVRTPGCPIH